MSFEEWKEYKLGDVCDRITDGAHFSPKEIKNGLPMASVKDLTRFGIEVSTCKKISETDFLNLVKQGCAPEIGDVLIAKDGNTSLDTVCVYNQPDKLVLLSSIAILRPNKKVTSDYLNYYFDNQETKSFLKENFRSGSAIPRVILRDFRNAPIKVPPIKIQKKIGQIFRSIDDKIELNHQTNQILESIAQAIFKEWFIDFNFPGATSEMKESELGKVPKEWRVGKLGDILIVKGGTTPSTKVSEFWDGEYHWATPKDLSGLQSPVLLTTERKITSKGVQQISSGILPTGTLLLSSRAPIGYLAISTIPLSINQGFIAINGTELSNIFLLFWLKQNMEKVISRANGSTFLEISKTAFKEIEITIPSKELVAKFDKIATSLFEQIKNNEEQTKTLSQLRDNLLPRLMRGEIELL